MDIWLIFQNFLNPKLWGRRSGEMTPIESGGREATAELIFSKELPRKATVLC
jgi:hypothetical protein